MMRLKLNIVMTMSMITKYILIFSFTFSFLSSEAKSNCLSQVAEFAKQICGEIEKSGTKTTVDANGKLTANVGNIVKKVIGSGSADVSGKILEENYNGLLQDQLGSELFNLRDCRKKMVDIAVPQACKESVPRKIPNKEPITQESYGKKSAENKFDYRKNLVNTGEWFSQIFCENGKSFYLEIDFVGFRNGVFTGYSHWHGSTQGSDEVILSKSNIVGEKEFYNLISKKRDTYRYKVYILDSNTIKGDSIGKENCPLELRHK